MTILVFLDAVYLRDGAPSVKACSKPGVDNRFRQLGAHDASADCNDLRVVALACPLRRIRIVALGGANSVHLVGCDRHPNPGPAQPNGSFEFTPRGSFTPH